MSERSRWPDFDLPIERHGTDSLRWDKFAERDVLPLWVADMDFRAPDCVIRALASRVAHGVFGYTHAPAALRPAIVEHVRRHYDWDIDADWIVFLPGVVGGLHSATRQLTAPGQHVLVPTPVYHHLSGAAERAPRPYSRVPLEQLDGRWVLRGAALRTAVQPASRLLLLCNPQNPGGTVLTRPELEEIAGVCVDHDLLICSDEIHADLLLDPGLRHVPVASLSREISLRTVTLMSLSKAYNFPGCGLAWAIAENPTLRHAMRADLHATIPEPSLFGYAATLAALEEGAEWHAALIRYLARNRDTVERRLAALPGLSVTHSEASYLAWIDASALGLPDPAALLLRHGVALSPGSEFGAPGFVRLNFGTQAAVLELALDRITTAVRTQLGA